MTFLADTQSSQKHFHLWARKFLLHSSREACFSLLAVLQILYLLERFQVTACHFLEFPKNQRTPPNPKGNGSPIAKRYPAWQIEDNNTTNTQNRVNFRNVNISAEKNESTRWNILFVKFRSEVTDLAKLNVIYWRNVTDFRKVSINNRLHFARRCTHQWSFRHWGGPIPRAEYLHHQLMIDREVLASIFDCFPVIVPVSRWLWASFLLFQGNADYQSPAQNLQVW